MVKFLGGKSTKTSMNIQFSFLFLSYHTCMRTKKVKLVPSECQRSATLHTSLWNMCSGVAPIYQVHCLKVVAHLQNIGVMERNRGVGSLWGDKALEGQVIVCEQWFAPPMLCLLRTFRRLWKEMSYLQFEMTGHDVKLSNYQIYSNIAKFSWKINTFSLNTSKGRRLKKTKKTKENLGYIFGSYSWTGKYLGLKLHRCSSEVRNQLKKNFGGDLQPFANVCYYL